MSIRLVNRLIRIILSNRNNTYVLLYKMIEALATEDCSLAIRLQKFIDLDIMYERQEERYNKNSVTISWKDW